MKPAKPTRGFTFPAAAPGELDEGALSLVDEDELVSVFDSEDSVGVALLLFSVPLEAFVELGAAVAEFSLVNFQEATCRHILTAANILHQIERAFP